MRERLVQDQPDPYEEFMGYMRERQMPPEDYRRLRGFMENHRLGAVEFDRIKNHIAEHDIQPNEIQPFLEAYAASCNKPDSPALQRFLGSRLRGQDSGSDKKTDKLSPAIS